MPELTPPLNPRCAFAASAVRKNGAAATAVMINILNICLPWFEGTQPNTWPGKSELGFNLGH